MIELGLFGLLVLILGSLDYVVASLRCAIGRVNDAWETLLLYGTVTEPLGNI